MAKLDKEMIKKLHSSIGRNFTLVNHPDEATFDPTECAIGCVLDTETTDIELDTIEVTEVAVRKFLYHKPTKTIIKPLGMFNQLNEPEEMDRLTPKIQALTGITPEMLVGHKINKDELKDFLEEVDIIIAHNASFDFDKIENVLGVKTKKSWHCSFRQVDWRNNHDSPSGSMELLALFFGFDYEAHRAIVDVDATLHLLMVSNTLSEMMDNAGMTRVELRGWLDQYGSTSVKDTLKNDNETGYRFRFDGDKNPNDKHWFCEVPQKDIESVIKFIETTLDRYNPKKGKEVSITQTTMYK